MIVGNNVKLEQIKESDATFSIYKKKNLFVRVIVFIIIIVVLSGLYLVYAWNRYQDIAESKAIMLAQSLESVFHPEHIAKLTGSAEDLEKSDYILMKKSLSQLVEATNPISFAYLMIERDENVVFLMDSEPADSVDYSPPGQIYEEADNVLRNTFISGKTVLTEPTTDRWGTWISVLVPVKDPTSDRYLAVFGIDYDASEWYADLRRQMLPDAIIILCLNLLVFAWFHSWAQKSSLKKLSKKIAFDEALYHSVFDQTPVGIAIMHDKNYATQSEFGVMNINPMFERILMRESSDLVNTTWPEITHPEDLKADLEKFEQFKAGVISGYSMEKRFLRPNGSSVWTNMIVSPLQGFSDDESLHLCLIEDITSKKRTSDALKESERSKSVLISNLPGMAYRCNYDRDWTMQFVSDGCTKLTGYAPESLMNNRDVTFNSLITPEYREPLWREWERIIDKKLPFEYEYEITSASGERKWVLELGEGVYGKNGEVEALEGIILDISDRKKSEEETKRLLERTLSMFNNHEAVMLLIEPLSGEIIDSNTAASTFYGYSKEELLNMKIQDINTLDKDELSAMRLKALNKGRKYFTFPHQLKSGEIRVVDVYSTPIEYEGKKVLFSIIFDVSEREKATKKNEFLAYHDHLTGVFNRRYFDEEFERRVKRGDFPIAFLLGNIDGFKTFNDAFGHVKGDAVLKDIANRLASIIIDGSVLARVGGDEFAILISGKNETEIRQCLDKLTREFDKELEDSGKDALITISWGHGIQKDERDTLDDLHREAEAFLNNRKFYNTNSLRSKTVNVIMETLFMKSEREKKHSERVGKLCESIARKMNFSKPEVDKIRVAGLLHDIGKIGIEEAILNKEGKLDAKEWEVMKLHPVKGASILVKTIEYNDIAEIVLLHHERYDGKGYPNGLAGEEIPLMARIIAVSDAYDAMTEQRTYRTPFSKEEAIAELKKCSGTQFDPRIVNTFINMVMGVEKAD
ncbi:MAG: PAS domain S-box protein [Erysipelotrichaceae bacterium]|nr:PAS domain S-box protein [Erysipelotrichaceae bacterium]